MNEVKVMFSDSKYDYTTSVSPQATEQSCKDYFIGYAFNLGQYPKDDYQQCTGIEFINNNEVTA